MAGKPITEGVFKREMKALRSEFQRDLQATTKALVETIVQTNGELRQSISLLGDRFENALSTSGTAHIDLESRLGALEKRVSELETK